MYNRFLVFLAPLVSVVFLMLFGCTFADSKSASYLENIVPVRRQSEKEKRN